MTLIPDNWRSTFSGAVSLTTTTTSWHRQQKVRMKTRASEMIMKKEMSVEKIIIKNEMSVDKIIIMTKA